MGILEILTIVFIVLKLMGTIDWSWWYVVLPELIAIVGYVIWFGFLAWLATKLGGKL